MPPNVAGYDVKQAEIAFVAGAAAAMLSKSNAVSYVGGMEIPSIVNAGKEFGNGARYVNPKIKYFESYTGDFDNVAKAREATAAAIAQGADVHYHILNLGLRGLEQAAKEKNTHIIGSYTDRCGTDPLYVAYSITGVGYPGAVRDRATRERHLAAGLQGVRPRDGTEGVGHGRLPDDARDAGEDQADRRRHPERQDQGVGRMNAAALAAAAHPAAAPILSLAGIGKRFGAFQALDDVSLDLMPGDVHCLLGENGAGKSTLCNVIFGVHQPDAGTMQVDGAPYRPRNPREALAHGIAMVHQHFSLVDDASVLDNLLLGQARGWLDRAAKSEAGADGARKRRPRSRARCAHLRPVGGRAAARRDRQVPDARAAPPAARRTDRRAAARRDRRAARHLRTRRGARLRGRARHAQAAGDLPHRDARDRAAIGTRGRALGHRPRPRSISSCTR